MTLKQCTKEELLEIFARLKKQHPSSEWYIERILIDLHKERELKEIAQAENWAKISHEARTQYAELVKPYTGKKLTDVPIEIINKAEELLQTAQRADREYNRLMHIATGG